MAAHDTWEPLPETTRFLPQQQRKSSRLEANANWHPFTSLSSGEITRFRVNMAFTNWRHTITVAFYWFLCCIWSALLINMHIFIPFLLPPRFNSSGEHCAPDGSFRLESFSVVDPAWFFQVVIGFGSLDFTVAKTIDIIWDVVSICINMNSKILATTSNLKIGCRPCWADIPGIHLVEDLLKVPLQHYDD